MLSSTSDTNSSIRTIIPHLAAQPAPHFTTHFHVTQKNPVVPEFQHQNKLRIAAWASHASHSSQFLLLRCGWSRRARGEALSLHLPRDAGGRVQQTPITHDVWEHKALQVLLEKPVLNYGIREHWKTSLHEGWHLGQQPLTAQPAPSWQRHHITPHLSPKPLIKSLSVSMQSNHIGKTFYKTD